MLVIITFIAGTVFGISMPYIQQIVENKKRELKDELSYE